MIPGLDKAVRFEYSRLPKAAIKSGKTWKQQNSPKEKQRERGSGEVVWNCEQRAISSIRYVNSSFSSVSVTALCNTDNKLLANNPFT